MLITETDRLVIEEMSPADAPFMLALLNTESWKKFIGDRNVHTEEAAAAYISDRIAPGYKKNGFGFYTVRLKENNLPIGISGLVKRDGLEDVDVGFAFLPEYEAKGYGYESTKAILDIAKNKLGIKSICAITVEYNERSIQLIKKLGLTYKETVRLPNDTEDLMVFVKEL